MSRSTSVYFGPYVKIKRNAMVMPTTVKGCSVCKKEMDAKFCSECGTAINYFHVIKSMDLDAILSYMGYPTWGFLYDADQPNNYSFFFDNYDHETYTIGKFFGYGSNGDVYKSLYDISDMPVIKDKELEFVNKFNELYGEGSMTVHYGALINSV